MKVVLFCGGLGTRLRDYSDGLPKPMVPIGNRPILWHIMRYYAFFGYTEFILCLGYKAGAIKEYFLNYQEAASNDFVLTSGGRDLRLLSSDIDDWTITFVDTGLNSNVGERLLAVRDLVGDEPFLANYTDGVTDLPMPDLMNTFHQRTDAAVVFLAVPPPLTLHVAEFDSEGTVSAFDPIREAGLWINAGYFAMRPEIFDYIGPGEDMVEEPFRRLAEASKLIAHPYQGFYGSMDTFKDKQALDDLYESGPAPWEVWKPRKARLARAE